jgi:death-on-curing family protein
MTRRGRKKRKIYIPSTRIFYKAINILKKMYPTDDFTVMNSSVFKTISEHVRWELGEHGFIYSVAKLFYDIIMDHPLVDGNKRLAVLVTNAYIERNGYYLLNKNELYELAISVASGRRSVEGVYNWLRRNLRKPGK